MALFEDVWAENGGRLLRFLGYKDGARSSSWEIVYAIVTGLLVSIIVLRLTISLSRRIRGGVVEHSLRERATRKVAERDKKRSLCEIPQVLAAVARQVKGSSVVELLAAMGAGELTSEEIVCYFCWRARESAGILNATTEEFFDEALAEARLSDSRRRSGEPVRLLEGIPISVKDVFDQKGADSTCGSATRCFRTLKSDGLLVELLRDAGAIPFVRSNVPQALMLPETDNNVWGRTSNPWDVSRSVGGSSGGEGGLIAFGASPLGIGTDIGGSIRNPAHVCGIVGLKPTPHRISHQGISIPRVEGKNGQVVISSSAGPMGSCVDDLSLVLRAWLSPKMWRKDVQVAPVPFDSAEYNSDRPLVIGYYTNDGFVTPAPAIQRAVMEAVEGLRGAGHTVIPFEPPRVEEMVCLYYGIMAADGAMRCMIEGLEGEQLFRSYRTLYRMSRLPLWLRHCVCTLLGLFGQRRHAALLTKSRGKSVYSHWSEVVEILKYRDEFTRMWRKSGLDAVICPPGALPALPHGMSEQLTPTCSYLFMYNILNYPAGVVPVTVTRSDECEYQVPKEERDILSRLVGKAVTGSEGLPVGVQVAALPWHDETCLRVMKDLEDAIGRNFCPSQSD